MKLFKKPVFSASAKTRHLVVISVDALNARDFDELKGLPNFGRVIKEGSYAKEVMGVYPSLTYVSHTSIITGTYPEKHGIFTNEIAEPGQMHQYWYWFRKYIKVPTLYDMAEKANMKVGAIFWPVMGGAKIDYNLAEVWKVREDQNQIRISLKSGTPIPILKMYSRYGKLLNGISQPNLDNFSSACACYLIKSKKPNLFLLHLNEVDHARHKHGVMSENAKEALRHADRHFGEIVQAVKDAGIYDDTTFIILGDHGFADVDHVIYLNSAFRKEGLIDVDSDGKLISWKAYANYCDGSVQIKVKDDDTKNKVRNLLERMKNDPDSGIMEIYTKEDLLKRRRLSGDYDFMCEAKKGYYFANDWDKDDVIRKVDKADFNEEDTVYYAATHGFDPETPEYRTFFMAAGKGIKKGVVIPKISLVDEGPTMADLLGLNLKDADGRVLKEMITE